MARQRTVLGGIDGRLAVLDADAHGEGLGLHGKPRLIQHFKGVTGAVTQSQDHMAGGQVTGLPVLADGDGADRAVLYPYMLQPGVEADVRPGRLQLLPQGLQGDVELVGATWGLASVKMVSGAPQRTSVSRMKRWRRSFVPVFSLPSEKAPAPPSPNWTLLSGSSGPPDQKRSTSA